MTSAAAPVFVVTGPSGAGKGTLIKALVERVPIPLAGSLVLDRIHPDRREGCRPKLATKGRVVACELATHAVPGAVLGGLVRR